MGFGEAVRSCFDKFLTFSGRARRAEYWWFVLFCVLGSIIAGVIDRALFGSAVIETYDSIEIIQKSVVGGIFSLVTFFPSLSVMVRRLHDTGRSGWWFWINLIPLVGWLVFLWFMLKPGDRGANFYGPDPIGDQPLYPRA